MKLELVRIQGKIRELTVGATRWNSLADSPHRALAAGAAVGNAMEGLAGAAMTAALSTGDTTEEVRAFACYIGDYKVYGQFRWIGFEEGDEVVAAVTANGEVREAYAITRPKDRVIWVHPECKRGTIAYWKRAFKLASWAGIAFSMFTLVTGWIVWNKHILESQRHWSFWQAPISEWTFLELFAAVMLPCGFLTVFTCVLPVVASHNKYAKIGNAIFTTLGFKNPQLIDLTKKKMELSNEERNNMVFEDQVRFEAFRY